MFRKTDVLVAGNYQDVRYMQDYYLWMQMIIAGFKGYNIPEVTAIWKIDIATNIITPILPYTAFSSFEPHLEMKPAERPEIASEYYEELPEFALRLQVKAGLTGYAQVYGKYNTTPYDKLLMDLM